MGIGHRFIILESCGKKDKVGDIHVESKMTCESTSGELSNLLLCAMSENLRGRIVIWKATRKTPLHTPKAA